MIPGLRAAMKIMADVSGRRRLVVAFLGSLVTAALELMGVGLVLPLVIAVMDPDAASALPGVLADLVPRSYDRAAAAILAAAVVAVFALRAAVTLAFRWWLHGFVNAGEARLATRLMDAYMRAPVLFHRRRNSADLVRVLQLSIEHLFTRVIMSVLTISTEGLVVAALFAVLLLLQPTIAVFAVVYFGVVGIVFSRLTSGRAKRVGRRYQQEHAEGVLAIQEAFGGIVETLVRGTTEISVRRFQELKDRAARTKQQMQFLSELPRTYLEAAFLVGIGLLVVLVVGSSESQSDATAALALVAAVGFRVMPSLVKVAGALTSARAGMAALDVVEADLATLGVDPASPVRGAASTLSSDSRPPAHIQLVDVGFRYPDTPSDVPPVIHRLSLDVPPGQWIGVIGGSGAGKTTLLLVLLGLLDPTTGAVLADGRSIAQDPASWRSRIGYVPQDLFLLDATLAENIRFGLHMADDGDRLERSIGDAALRGFVASLPDGLQTPVAERGARLSGGQRQRIGIARALYRGPSVLILDEATSALDVETERSILQTLDELRGQLTIVSVAHRASTVRRCDRLVVLEGGHVTADGPFDVVYERSAYFRQMVTDSRDG